MKLEREREREVSHRQRADRATCGDPASRDSGLGIEVLVGEPWPYEGLCLASDGGALGLEIGLEDELDWIGVEEASEDDGLDGLRRTR